MKKYKLIKEYPGSPQLGAIIARDDTTGTGFYASSMGCIPKYYVEEFPEYWELVKSEYKINLVDFDKAGLPIHSVTRTSDGVSFKVGNVLTGDKRIVAIILNNKEDSIWLQLERIGGSSKSFIKLAAAKKAKPLFKSIDGVEMYSGDEIYIVSPKWKITTEICSTCMNSGLYKFANEQEARKFVNENKPLFSYTEVMGLGLSELRDLARSRFIGD